MDDGRWTMDDGEDTIMPKTAPFDTYTEKYEEWFSRHSDLYHAELGAVRRRLPSPSVHPALEIGVGSGRFAAPLNIGYGIEPSQPMAVIARRRGIRVIRGVAEALPLKDRFFTTALMVTTICFLDDIDAALAEAFRVLAPGGSLLIGFIAKKSWLGMRYRERKAESPFYHIAQLYTVPEVVDHLCAAGFGELAYTQTLFEGSEAGVESEPIEDGYGDGAFVVVAATRA